jgi:hypothetical protein
MPRIMPILGRVTLLLGLASCGGDGFSPTVDSVAGTYQATTFTFTGASTPTDLLAMGASVTIILAPDGTTSGRMFVPGVGAGGGDLDADLAGTWALTGAAVTFDQSADTFMRDLPFTVEPSRLRTRGTFDAETVVLVLTK